jgi:hypothetical protein
VNKTIRDTFENYFEKVGEGKVDLFDFYKLIEKSEVNVK